MKLTPKQWIFFLIVAIIFVLIEAKGLTQVGPGDENVYFYMAKMVSQDQMPYKDFLYVHPPLHIFVLAALIKIFGVNFFILKSATLSFLLTASFFLYALCLELFQNKFNDKNANLISVISIILFLSSFTTLFTATFSVGIELSVMLMMMSFYLTFVKKYFIGGIFAGLAGLTRFYALVPLFALFVFIFLKKLQEKKLKDFLLMFLGFFVIFGIIMILLTVLYGHNFIDDAIKYHFLKPKLPGQRTTVYENVIKENWIII
ncbi:MAG: glycosyltransferase family 39 protein, partial [Nanoarchaeota archaeon]